MAPVSEQPGRASLGVSGKVGADLRLARERLGWDLASLSARLRIRLPYLEAIEDGRLDDLPGNAYAVGFLRTYAGAVGLDPDEISRRFRAEVADVNRRTELVFPAPVPERGVPALAVVLVGLVIVVGAYAAWYKLSSSRPSQQEPVAALPQRLQPLATPTPQPLQPPFSPASAPAPAPLAVQPAPAPVAVAAQPAPPAASAPNVVIPVPVPVPVSIPGVTPPPPAAAPPNATTATAAASNPLGTLNPDGGRLLVRAKEDAWVQLKDKSTGNVVAEHVLKAGETMPVPNRSGLLLAVGNAGGTELLLDGQPTPSLGTQGMVRRNLPMEVDQVRDGKLAANYVAPAAPAAAPGTQPRPATAN